MQFITAWIAWTVALASTHWFGEDPCQTGASSVLAQILEQRSALKYGLSNHKMWPHSLVQSHFEAEKAIIKAIHEGYHNDITNDQVKQNIIHW